ncbi:ABC transporter substrate-binding protein [Chelativorans composti]|uniref:Thiamine pyrimidine synthase n=1 Tax=Chelativorans composti TaxID=768533 RepID=A0ABW5DC87_9HYPH
MIRTLISFALLLMPLAASAQQPDAPRKELQRVTVALDWMLNTNHVGIVVAKERGFYEKHGLDVEILPYSDTNSAALLASGASDFAYVATLAFLTARAANAEITALWVTMQRETGRLVYNSDNKAITRPADLSGKVYAGFGSDWEKALIGTMIRTDGGEPVWETVTLNTGAYESLAVGRVDFTLEVATWEGVNSQLLGRRQSWFNYADYGVPDQQNGYIATTARTLEEQPETVKAFMMATLAGYEWAADHPDEAAEILIAAGDFPNPELVRGSLQVIVEGNYLRNGDWPVGKIDHSRLERMAKFLADNGVLKDRDGKVLGDPGNVRAWYNEEWREQ